MPQTDPFIKRLRITKVIHETKDARTFILEPLDDWQPVYEAGQFITFVFYTRHGEKRRSYSISSSPALGEPLAVTIKKIDNGEFSRFLVYHGKEGTIMYSSGIGGHFILPQKIDNKKQYFFIAAGSGITPCYSIIKTLLGTSSEKIVLIYSNRTEADALFYDDLKLLREQHQERFTIRFLFSSILNVYHSRLSNWLLRQLLDQYLIVDEKEALFYICGPFDYMLMVEITLLNRVPRQNIFKENFSSLPRLITPRPPDTDAHKVTIHFGNQSYQLTVQYPQTILATAKANNIQLPYSCEAGRCSSCVATCTSGKIWMAYNEVLTDDEIEKGRALVCQGFPVGGDVEIRY
ncbi:MAG: iron-sulfur cluster-binding domain-containing protein [Ferruginibacter sp.]